MQNKIQDNFRYLEKALSSLDAKIELGFSTLLNRLDSIIDLHEIELIAEIKSASELAWSAQLIKDSFWRQYRMEQSLGKISSVTEKIVIYSKSRLKEMAFELSKTDAKTRLRIPNEFISTLEILRYASISLYLNAAIYAELDNTHFSVRVLEQNVEQLMSCYLQVGNFFLKGSGPIKFCDVTPKPQRFEKRDQSREEQDRYIRELHIYNLELINYINHKDKIVEFNTIYPYLLDSSLSDIISFDQIQSWVQRFDSDNLELLNTEEKKVISLEGKEKKALIVFANLLDGSYEDLLRLKGYLKEYQYVLENNMSIEEYRQLLSIQINLTSDDIGKELYFIPNNFYESVRFEKVE